MLDDIFSALSDRTRRSMITRLAESPATVGELSEPFNISLPAVSKHLKILEKVGLIKRKIEGRVHLCMLVPGPLSDAEEWLIKYSEFWSNNLDSLAEYVERKNARESNLTNKKRNP